MSYYNLLYHVIFRTKYSIPAIDIAWEKELYTYIWGFIKNKGSKLYRIGGMPDHLHILMEITPKIALADFIRDLKTSSAKWLKGNSHFPLFQGWGVGYAAFTYAEKDKDMIVRYIMGQKEHHVRKNFNEELQDLLMANGWKTGDEYPLKDDD